jgi:hypothetical protein
MKNSLWDTPHIDSGKQNGPEELHFENVWQPLSIDRGDEKYIQAVEATEEAIKTIEQDNGFAATEPDERNAVLYTAKGTLDALKEGTPSKDQIDSGILRPLKYLSKKFADTAIGIAAKKAVEAIIAWFAVLL